MWSFDASNPEFNKKYDFLGRRDIFASLKIEVVEN